MLEEDAVSAADCGLPISPRVIGKSDAGCGIEQVALHAADGHTGGHSALDNSIRQIPHRRLHAIRRKVVHSAVWIDTGLTRDVTCRIKVESLLLLVAIGSVQT